MNPHDYDNRIITHVKKKILKSQAENKLSIIIIKNHFYLFCPPSYHTVVYIFRPWGHPVCHAHNRQLRPQSWHDKKIRDFDTFSSYLTKTEKRSSKTMILLVAFWIRKRRLL